MLHLPITLFVHAVVGVFAILCIMSASYQQSAPGSAPEAIASVTTSCPATLPDHFAPIFASTATMYNMSVTVTRLQPANASAPPGVPYDISVATTMTLAPTQDTRCIAVHVPAVVLATLQHVYLSSSDEPAEGAGVVAAAPAPRLCVCADQSPARPLPVVHPRTPEPGECELSCEDALRPLPLSDPGEVYNARAWHVLTLPERVAAGFPLKITWIARPDLVFLASTPFKLPACAADVVSANVSTELCSESPGRWEQAVLSSVRAFAPSVLRQGAETAGFAMTVSAPADLRVLWSTPVEQVATIAGTVGSEVVLLSHAGMQHVTWLRHTGGTR